MTAQTATLRMLTAVNAIVDKARSLHDGIPETVIVLGASGASRHGQNHGHFAPKSWSTRAREGDRAGDSSGRKEYYGEILLAGESLQRGAVGTLGTILHELVHAYCFAAGIKETSNNNRYHNAKFKEIAEDFGLELEKAETIGWSLTTVPQETQEKYRAELDELEAAISVHRLGFSELKELLGEPEKAKPLKRMMQCPECQEPIQITKKFWELQGNGGWEEATGHEYDLGAGIVCERHNADYELYTEGGEDA